MQNVTDLYAALQAHAGYERDRLRKKLEFGYDTKPRGAGRHLSWNRDGKWWTYTIGRHTMMIERVPTRRALFNWYIAEGDESLGRCKVADGWEGEMNRDVPIEDVMDSVFDALCALISESQQ